MKYSQIKAMLAITAGSLRAIRRSPSAIAFSFIFPFVFIFVFGFIGNGINMQSFKVYLDPASDTANFLYKGMKESDNIKFVTFADSEKLNESIIKGKIAATVLIKKNSGAQPPYQVELKSTTSSNNQWPQVKSLIESEISAINSKIYPGNATYASFNFDASKDIQKIREYKSIDFILPGQLGFSLLSAAVFGVAFMFYNLRTTLVLKRFFATPIKRPYIILGEGLSRVIFQMITAVVIVGFGYLFFGFTLINGFETFLEMMVLSFIGLMVFMGFGFAISGIAKSESSIPPIANIFTLPQFLLAGTFFPVDVFPKWLQPISYALPLTHLNTALRSVAFEGMHLWNVKMEIGILLAWGIVAYAFAAKSFKWE